MASQLSASAAPAPDTGPAPGAAASRSVESPDAGRPLTIAELLRLTPESGLHVVAGFVTRVAPCPPCPKGAVCKPCMEDHVVISDVPGVLESYNQLGAAPNLIVFIPSREDLDRLVVGRRYQLTVRVRPTRTTSLPIHDVELVSREELPSEP